MNLPDIFDAILEFGGDAAIGGAKQVGRSLIADYRKRKAEDAREILFEEISSGDKWPSQVASQDDAVAVIYRYLRAANEGAARVNLRLLAKTIAGKIRTDTLVADEFSMYADSLANLSRDEIIVVAALWKHRIRHGAIPHQSYGWQTVVQALGNDGWKPGRVVDAATRALRSGLVNASTQAGLSSGGGWIFSPSTLMEELAQSVDFEDALRAEAK